MHSVQHKCTKKEVNMNTVDPIREKSDIKKMKNYLLANNYRDYLLFIMGINTGLRISDLLKLKVSDIRDKFHIIIAEKKTGKEKKFILNDQVQEVTNIFIQNKDDDEYIFQSKRNRGKAIDRTVAYKILNSAADAIDLKTKIGTHTLRKTFGYHLYQQTKDVALLQYLFNHSSPSTTLRYIGINQDVADKILQNFNL